MERVRHACGARAQSTMEYLLIVVAVLLAVIFGVKTVIQPKSEERMTQAGQVLDKAKTQINTAVVE